MSQELPTWDIGDPEPKGVHEVASIEFDDTDDFCRGVPLIIGKTFAGEWKTYLFGGDVYYDWAEMVRRFGPVREVK